MKRKVSNDVFLFCLAVITALLLTGCNPEAGAVTYEIIYPSGNTKNGSVYDETAFVEGTSYSLQWEKAEDDKKTYDYDLKILDENGSVLYEYPDIGSETMRGMLQGDALIWVCTERWTSIHRNGYAEGCLKECNLLLIDLRDGAILFQEKAGENEFYIISDGTRCYFYDSGKEESEKLFGLIKIPPENAGIYYRDTSDWSEKHTVYTFDYAKEPDIDTSKGVETRIRFYILEDQIKAAWTSYESTGNGAWEYLEKKVYEIPIRESVVRRLL